MPLTETHQVLLTIELILPEGTNPYWYQYGLVDFYLAPAVSYEQDNPGYFNGNGEFFPCNSLTSDYHGWDYPCITLNGLGVTELVRETWDHVKEPLSMTSVW